VTDEEVIAESRKVSFLNNARKEFRKACEAIEQAMRYIGKSDDQGDDRVLKNSVEHLRMEFEAIRQISLVLGLNIVLSSPYPVATKKTQIEIDDVL